MDNQLDMLIYTAMEYQKAKRRFMWMPTRFHRDNYLRLANELYEQKKSLITAMTKGTNKINIHSQYNTEER